MQTRDQKYTAIVHDQVSRIENQEGYKQYGAMAYKLPILIRTAGLTQALEFVNTRGKGLQKQLLKDLAVTVEQNDTPTLLNFVRSADLSEYMRLTQNIMAALLWYKRFAQSILKVDASEAVLLPEDEKK